MKYRAMIMQVWTKLTTKLFQQTRQGPRLIWLSLALINYCILQVNLFCLHKKNRVAYQELNNQKKM